MNEVGKRIKDSGLKVNLDQRSACQRSAQSAQLLFYNLTGATKLAVDTSLHGLGAVLTQQQQNWKYKLTVYGSRALTDTESRYSQAK